MTKTALPKREDVPEKYKWDVEDIFKNDEEWEQSYAELEARIPEIEAFHGKLGDSADVLYEVLQLEDSLSVELSQLYVYARMKYDEDTTNSFYQGLNDRARQLVTRFSQTASFVTPEILSIPEEKLSAFLEEKEELNLYEHALDRLNKSRPHVLSEAEEALLARAGDVTGSSANTFSMLNNADMKFPVIKDENGEEVEVTQGRFISLMKSSDRRVRKDAFEAMYHTYQSYHNTLASTLQGSVKKNIFQADVRHYESARQAALAKNHIPEIVYDQLIDTINEGLPLLHRYAALRKRALGLENLHLYDMYTPMVENVEYPVTYEDAKVWMEKGLAALGEDYQSVIREGLENRWVDVEETAGKRSGAYSSGTYGTKPYILMNWQDDISNLFTLAHEFGHSAHSYYTRKHQPIPYADYSIFIAEVASTTNEALLHSYLYEHETDRKKQLYLLNHFLEGFRGTVFRQTMFAEFERDIHQMAETGVPLTPDKLNETYYALNERYFGPDVEIDPEIAYEWSRIPHFYMNFYVYQYATGYSAAAALSKKIQEEGAPAVKRYIEFLQAGNSMYPIDALNHAGVDMTSPEPVKQALQLFEETLDEFEKLLDESNA